MDASGLRAEFPVLARRAYLNAGTDGPLPAAAGRAAAEELERELQEGRAGSPLRTPRRARESSCAAPTPAALSCEAHDVALTTCTTEGIGQVVAGLEFGARR